MAARRATPVTSMVAGHFGFAAIVKSREPRTPLWALMLACQWLDVIFVPLFILGVERLVPVAGTNGGYGRVIITADYTHSLVGALALAVLFGAVAAIPWGARNGLVLGSVVFSHWLLDLVVHRGDMAILPWQTDAMMRAGFGLWRAPVAAASVELALVVAGWICYRRAALATARAGGQPTRTAQIASALLLFSGLLTVTLDVLGV